MKHAAAQEPPVTPAMIEAARKALEDVLIERRDSRFSVLGVGNGMVVRESDGTPSDVIRMSTHDAIRFILNHLSAAPSPTPKHFMVASEIDGMACGLCREPWPCDAMSAANLLAPRPRTEGTPAEKCERCEKVNQLGQGVQQELATGKQTFTVAEVTALMSWQSAEYARLAALSHAEAGRFVGYAVIDEHGNPYVSGHDAETAWLNRNVPDAIAAVKGGITVRVFAEAGAGRPDEEWRAVIEAELVIANAAAPFDDAALQRGVDRIVNAARSPVAPGPTREQMERLRVQFDAASGHFDFVGTPEEARWYARGVNDLADAMLALFAPVPPVPAPAQETP